MPPGRLHLGDAVNDAFEAEAETVVAEIVVTQRASADEAAELREGTILAEVSCYGGVARKKK